MAESEKFKVTILGKEVEFDTEPRPEDIDYVAGEIIGQAAESPEDLAKMSEKYDIGQETLLNLLRFHVGSQEGLERFGEGVKQVGMGIGANVGLVDPADVQAYTDEITAERRAFEQSPVGQSFAGQTGVVAGEVAPSLAIPGALYAQGATLPARVGMSTFSGAGAEFLKPTESADVLNVERGLNTLVGGAAGGGSELVLQGVPRAVRGGYRLLTGAPNTLKRLVGKEDIMTEAKRAAEDIGTFLSPGEATGRKEVMAFETKVGNVSPETTNAISSALRGREQTLNNTVNEVVESISTGIHGRRLEALSVQMNDQVIKDGAVPKLFSGTRYDALGQELFNRFQKNPVFQQEIKAGNIKPNSIEYFDTFKRFLDEQQDKAFTKTTDETASKTLGGQIQKFKEDFIQQLENATSGTYKEYRNLKQLGAVQGDLQTTLNNMSLKPININGQTVELYDPVEFYRKTMKSKKDFDKLLSNLDNNPKARAKLIKVRTILAAIENSPLRGAFGKAEDIVMEPGGGGILGAEAAVTFSALDFMNKNRAEQLINMIADDKWDVGLLDSVKPSMLKNIGIGTYNALTKILDMTAAAASTENTPSPVQ
jgi:hypothetical protein